MYSVIRNPDGLRYPEVVITIGLGGSGYHITKNLTCVCPTDTVFIGFDSDKVETENYNRFPPRYKDYKKVYATYNDTKVEKKAIRIPSKCTPKEFRVMLDLLETKGDKVWLFLCIDDSVASYRLWEIAKEFPCKTLVTGFDGYRWNITGRPTKPGAWGTVPQVGYTSSWLPTILRMAGAAIQAMFQLNREEIQRLFVTEDIRRLYEHNTPPA